MKQRARRRSSTTTGYRSFIFVALSCCLCLLACLSSSTLADELLSQEELYPDTTQFIQSKIESHPHWRRNVPLDNQQLLDPFLKPAVCKQYGTCVNFNDNCDWCNDTDPTTPCNRVCKFPNGCSKSRDVNTCVDTLVDMECNDSSQCEGVFLDGPLYCSLADKGLCKPILVNLLPNDHCDNDAQCRSRNCDGDQCRGSGLNGWCNNTADCQPSLICDRSLAKCVRRFPDGFPDDASYSCGTINAPRSEQTCFQYSRVCEPTQINVWQCQEAFDVGYGISCTNQLACNAGLSCINGSCLSPSTATLNNPCDASNASIACGPGLDCVCNRFRGESTCQSTANFCSNEWIRLWRCIGPNKHNCHPFSDPHVKNSCVRKHCKEPYLELLECQLSGNLCTSGAVRGGMEMSPWVAVVRVVMSFFYSSFF